MVLSLSSTTGQTMPQYHMFAYGFASAGGQRLVKQCLSFKFVLMVLRLWDVKIW